jgi:hypothetical protein
VPKRRWLELQAASHPGACVSQTLLGLQKVKPAAEFPAGGEAWMALPTIARTAERVGIGDAGSSGGSGHSSSSQRRRQQQQQQQQWQKRQQRNIAIQQQPPPAQVQLCALCSCRL